MTTSRRQPFPTGLLSSFTVKLRYGFRVYGTAFEAAIDILFRALDTEISRLDDIGEVSTAHDKHYVDTSE